MKFAPNNNHVMIDIETLGTRPGSVVLSIGAVKFDPCFSERTCNPRDKDRVFYANLDVTNQKNLGMTTDPKTIQWWSEQLPTAQTWLEKPAPVPVEVALTALVTWSKGTKFVWANGATFDLVLLEALFAKFLFGFPWHYRNYRCMRTLFEIARRFGDMPNWPEIELPAHVAHGDAIRQAWATQAMMYMIANGGKARKPW